MISVFSKISNNCLYYNKEPYVFPCQEGWHRPALSLFAKVFFVFSCTLPKVTYSQKFAFAQRSGAMKAPVGLLSDRTVLRSKMEGPRPDKFAFAQWSGAMKAPVGLLSDRTVLRKQDGGARPDKFAFARTRTISSVTKQTLTSALSVCSRKAPFLRSMPVKREQISIAFTPLS